eukprot:g1040.t1
MALTISSIVGNLNGEALRVTGHLRRSRTCRSFFLLALSLIVFCCNLVLVRIASMRIKVFSTILVQQQLHAAPRTLRICLGLDEAVTIASLGTELEASSSNYIMQLLQASRQTGISRSDQLS